MTAEIHSKLFDIERGSVLPYDRAKLGLAVCIVGKKICDEFAIARERLASEKSIDSECNFSDAGMRFLVIKQIIEEFKSQESAT
jgi:hypothetical protein